MKEQNHVNLQFKLLFNFLKWQSNPLPTKKKADSALGKTEMGSYSHSNWQKQPLPTTIKAGPNPNIGRSNQCLPLKEGRSNNYFPYRIFFEQLVFERQLKTKLLPIGFYI